MKFTIVLNMVCPKVRIRDSREVGSFRAVAQLNCNIIWCGIGQSTRECLGNNFYAGQRKVVAHYFEKMNK